MVEVHLHIFSGFKFVGLGARHGVRAVLKSVKEQVHGHVRVFWGIFFGGKVCFMFVWSRCKRRACDANRVMLMGIEIAGYVGR